MSGRLSTSLLLRQNGDVARCDDGSVIIHYGMKTSNETIYRCSFLDPKKHRHVITQLFGPTVFNNILAKNDGSSTSGLHGANCPVIWNETTVSFLLDALKEFKDQFLANADKQAVYETIAAFLNDQDFMHHYTPSQCEEEIESLLKEYSFQVFKNFNFECPEQSFKYFDKVHDVFGKEFPGAVAFGEPTNAFQHYNERLSTLLNELKEQNLSILKKQKNNLNVQQRMQCAFSELQKLIDDMRNDCDSQSSTGSSEVD